MITRYAEKKPSKENNIKDNVIPLYKKQLSYKQYTTNKMKKDYKAQRLYMKLSKADTFLKKIKAEQKISDYFFNKRKQEEKDK